MELWCSDRWSRLRAWGSDESWHDREGSATSCDGVVDELEDEEDEEEDFCILDMVVGWDSEAQMQRRQANAGQEVDWRVYRHNGGGMGEEKTERARGFIGLRVWACARGCPHSTAYTI